MRSFAASSAHQGLWLAEKMSPDTLNHALTMWDVDGEVDSAAMESAFLHVLGDAEAWRVTFVDNGSGLRVVPRELGDWRPFFLNLSAETDPEQAAREALADLVKQPFDLERDLLFRLGVVRLATDRSLLVIAYHHLISDGYGAAGMLSRRLAETYTALVRGEKVPELPHSWDAESLTSEAVEYLASPQFTEDTGFWRDYLADAPAPAQVPRVALSDATLSLLSEPMSSADRWAEVSASIGMVSRTLTVPRAEADAWTGTAQSMDVWMSSMLTAAAAVYFRFRCDRPEFLLSLAVANRAGAASRIPGLAVNVVPVRVRVPLEATFKGVADAVVDETYEIFGHTICHYSDIQRASGAVLTGRGSFGAVLNVVEFAEQLDFAGSPGRHLGGTTGTFDELSIGVYTDGSADSDLFLRLDAPADLYSRGELRFIGEELISYVRALRTAGSQPVGALDVVSGVERDRVLTAPNDTETPMPGLTVPELFVRQVERAGADVAVVSGESAVTYRELDERSSRLAEALRRRGVGAEVVVAVAMPRSVDLIVALLAVVRAGGAYLPIDPALPAERIRSMVGDASAAVLLTVATTAEVVAEVLGVPAVIFDDISAGSDGGDREWSAPVKVHRDNLVAVTHASLTDGAAAHVGTTHRNMERLVLDRRWREGGRSAVLWHSFTADALALELWVPLLNGGRVVVAPAGELTPATLTEWRAASEFATAWLPAGVFATVAAERPESLAGLREVWTGGDHVSTPAVRRVREACPDLTVVIGYGPAEATVFAAADRMTAAEPMCRLGIVGRPMDNTAVYVLGPGLAPLPAGVAGELYVAGAGLTRGYPRRPGQTAERFVPCQFGPPGGLMYRTGDRVRWGTDGQLEYLGRADALTRIRGAWVESVEIEEVLSEHPGLAHSVVVGRADDSGQRRLVAYVVPVGSRVTGTADRRSCTTVDEVRRFAAGRLPEFKVPSAFVMLERLPVAANGRVDRAALPEPEFGDGSARAPRNHTERVLARVFADALEVDRVGIDEDFFDLGGNSLRAIRLVGLIRAELKLEVSIRMLFAARTIAGLAETWDDLSRSSRPTLRKRTEGGRVV